MQNYSRDFLRVINFFDAEGIVLKPASGKSILSVTEAALNFAQLHHIFSMFHLFFSLSGLDKK